MTAQVEVSARQIPVMSLSSPDQIRGLSSLVFREICVPVFPSFHNKVEFLDMSIITLLTDFGIKDGNVGVMKGVIWGIAPATQIADISHSIGAQNVGEAALVLARTAPFYPSGTIHVVVVDPGVGTARRPIAARIGEQFFVLPDNGVITMALQAAGLEHSQFIHLDKPAYWLEKVSHVFHGRDIFAPVAAHLAAGVPLNAVGSPIDDPLLLQLPQPERIPQGWKGEIIHSDHFGNLSANITDKHLGGTYNWDVRIGGETIHGLVRTFGDMPAGTLVGLYGSNGNLVVCVVNGNAAERLAAGPGEPIEVLKT